MLSAHRCAGSFRYDAAVSTWLHRIVLNACLNRLRRAKSRPSAPLLHDYPVPDRTARVETAIMVQRALMRLPVEQRAAVVAVDMQGYSIAETAGGGRHDQEPVCPRTGSPGRTAGLPRRRCRRV
jgi:RNA polymerase sigma-70 factor (ECF subfamily)